MALICDTGPLYSLLDRRDADHARCVAFFEQNTEPLLVPEPVLVEVAWLSLRRLGSEALDAFLLGVEEANPRVENLTSKDYSRIRQLCWRYQDLRLSLVDGSVIATAERLGERRVATLDHRHFSVVKPAHTKALWLVPD